jgi:hypothetical protein
LLPIGNYHYKINNSIEIYSKINNQELSAKSSFISNQNYFPVVAGMKSEELKESVYVGKR